MTKVWAHLHLTRYKSFKSGRGPREVISVKVPGQKIRYESEIVLRDCHFYVSQKGRERTLKTNQRNVHAWVIGYRADFDPWLLGDWGRALYNPWKGPDFVDSQTLQPVYHASQVFMSGKDVYYRG